LGATWRSLDVGVPVAALAEMGVAKAAPLAAKRRAPNRKHRNYKGTCFVPWF
jgi:hypothetical protein